MVPRNRARRATIAFLDSDRPDAPRAGDGYGDDAQPHDPAVLAVGEQADGQKAPVGVSAAPTKTGKSHATFRRAIGLLHPAGSSSAGRAPLSFKDERLPRREQRPVKRGKQGTADR